MKGAWQRHAVDAVRRACGPAASPPVLAPVGARHARSRRHAEWPPLSCQRRPLCRAPPERMCAVRSGPALTAVGQGLRRLAFRNDHGTFASDGRGGEIATVPSSAGPACSALVAPSGACLSASTGRLTVWTGAPAPAAALTCRFPFPQARVRSTGWLALQPCGLVPFLPACPRRVAPLVAALASRRSSPG